MVLFIYYSSCSTKLSLADSDGILTEEIGKEVESIFLNMFVTTKAAEKHGKRPPPTKERKALKMFVQICQKPFFNPRIAKFTGCVYSKMLCFVLAILFIRKNGY
jgi:hypothetical protein